MNTNSMNKIIGIIGITLIVVSLVGVTLSSVIDSNSENRNLPNDENLSKSVPTNCKFDDPADFMVMDIILAEEFSSLNNYRIRADLNGTPFTLLVKLTDDNLVLLRTTETYFPDDSFNDFTTYPTDAWTISIDIKNGDPGCQIMDVTWNPSIQPSQTSVLAFYYLEKGVFDVHGEMIVKTVPDMISAVGVTTQLQWIIQFYSIQDGSLLWEFILSANSNGSFSVMKKS